MSRPPRRHPARLRSLKAGGPHLTTSATAPPKFPEIDLSGIKTISIAGRRSKVRLEHLCPPPDPSVPVGSLLRLLPRQLAAEGLRRLVTAVAEARRSDRPVVAMLGGHVVKVGASPALLALARRRALTALALNGAAAIHDFELAMWGQTSETVEETLGEGAFGMVEETSALMNQATIEGHRRGIGMGEALGRKLLELKAPNREISLLATGLELGLPVTVHVAIGADILHQHPTASGAAIGDTTLRDFRRLAAALRGLSGGVVLNLGSAVMMPEVFLKALSVIRNLGEPMARLTTANFDFQRHYRPTQNVLDRPTRGIGEGIEIVGHHEIMIPLFAALVLAELERPGDRGGRGGGAMETAGVATAERGRAGRRRARKVGARSH